MNYFAACNTEIRFTTACFDQIGAYDLIKLYNNFYYGPLIAGSQACVEEIFPDMYSKGHYIKVLYTLMILFLV